MPEEKTLRDVHVDIIHPRRPEPSYAELRAIPEWLKTERFVTCRMTEDDLYKLAEEALKTAGILRRIRLEGR